MAKAKTNENVAIPAPSFSVAEFVIVGSAPYVQNRFSKKAEEAMRATQAAGARSGKGKKRDPKDFDQCYQNAMYESKDGWHGVPATAFRNAMISACRIVGFKMTHAKLSVFVEADGYDKNDGTPLVKITKGIPSKYEAPAWNANGQPDIRVRAMWREGWEAKLRVRYDADQFSLADVSNLLLRVGMQVGVGEGRPDSKKSAGLGWGLFCLKGGK